MGKSILMAVGAFVLGVGVALGGFYLSRDANESTATTYGDWKLSCPPRADAAAQCVLTQDVMQGGTGATLVHMQLVGAQNARRLLIVVPHGVLIKPGLGLAVGNEPLRVLHYQTCDSVGCLAYLPLDASTLDSLHDAEAGRIIIVLRDGKELAYPCSLRGFAKGLGAFSWASFKRSSWLGGLLP